LRLFGFRAVARARGGDRLLTIEPLPVESLEEELHRRQLLRSEAAALEAGLVEHADLRWMAVAEHERRDVLLDLRAAADEGMRADAAELVDGGAAAADADVVLDDDVAGECRAVARDEMVAD